MPLQTRHRYGVMYVAMYLSNVVAVSVSLEESNNVKTAVAIHDHHNVTASSGTPRLHRTRGVHVQYFRPPRGAVVRRSHHFLSMYFRLVTIHTGSLLAHYINASYFRCCPCIVFAGVGEEAVYILDVSLR